MLKRVLVIENSKTVCLQLRQFLETKDCIVQLFFTHSYKEAYNLLKNNQNIFHAAIVDLNLPDCRIGDSVKLVNSHKIPIIVFTSEMDEDIKHIVLKNEVTDYVQKGTAYAFEKTHKVLQSILRKYDTTVLVVDDSKVYRLKIKGMLEKQNITVIEAKDGSEGLNIIRSNEQKIDLIITDYHMPVLDGMEMTGAIREKYDKDQLGIIILSSSDEKKIINEFIKLGANDYFVKPFEDDEFVSRININLELLGLFKTVRDQANKDYMTGAYNRRFFFNSGNDIVAKNRRKESALALATLDIDKFKNINDTYGHDVGDIAIKEITTILDSNLRCSDLTARFGGEEFCILLEDVSLEDCKKLFEKIRKNFESNIIQISNETSISYTVSIGVFYGILENVDAMIKKSDEALYKAKESGRNKVFFEF